MSIEEAINKIQFEIDRLDAIYDENSVEDAEEILQEKEGFESSDEYDGYVNGLRKALRIIKGEE